MQARTPPDLLRVMAARMDEIYMELQCVRRNLEANTRSYAELDDQFLGLAAQLRAVEHLQGRPLAAANSGTNERAA